MTPAMIVALTLWMEARGEPAAGRELVATVIVNRAKARRMSVEAVCLERKQFSCWNDVKASDGVPDVVVDELVGPVWRHCMRLGELVVAGRYEPLNDAEYFYNPEVCHPAWARDMVVVVKRGRHWFLREA